MKIFLSLLLLCCFLNVYSQRSDNDYNNLIDSAIRIRIEKLTEGIKNIYLINESNLPYIFSSQKGETQFKSIMIYDSKNKKILKKGIDIWKIFAVLNNNKLTIDIIDFKVTYKKNSYNYSNGGGTKVIFEYSCTVNKWVLLDFKSIRN